MGDLGSISGLGRSSGKGNSYPLQDSCLENSTDRGAWQAIVHGVARSRTQRSDLLFSRHLESWCEHILSYLNINMSRIQYFIELRCQGTHQKIYGGHILVLKKLYYIQNIITHPISCPPHLHIYTTSSSHTHLKLQIVVWEYLWPNLCTHMHTLMNLITSTQFEHMLSGLFQRIASPGI